MKAVVLAAGRGKRLWPLTENRPKHLIPLAGSPILERTLKDLVTAGIREIVLVVNYKAEMIRAFLGEGERLGCKIVFALQKRAAGTADALRSCEGQLKGQHRFIVIYGDDYFASSGVRRFVKQGMETSDNLMATAEVEEPSKFGRVEVRKGLVSKISEKTKGGGPARVNAGFYILSESVLDVVKITERSRRGEYELTDSVASLIRKGERVRAFPLKRDEWLGVTYPWDLLEANRLALDQPVSVRGRVESNVRVRGRVSLGKGSVVKAGTYIEGPVFVGDGCVVGPNSYIRPYTSVGNGCKVGAGCEVKNSLLMDRVKVPHLSYVGDSVLGEGSSIGAGTVTANLRFDDAVIGSRVEGLWVASGRRKLGAIIGDSVRTGINVSLFPGVKVGSGAWIGPGAVVKKDVPSGGRVRS